MGMQAQIQFLHKVPKPLASRIAPSNSQIILVKDGSGSNKTTFSFPSTSSFAIRQHAQFICLSETKADWNLVRVEDRTVWRELLPRFCVYKDTGW